MKQKQDELVQVPDTIISPSEENQLEPQVQEKKTITKKIDVNQWFKEMGWKENPFTFTTNPELFVGYENQRNKILNAIKAHHKFSLVLGPTGSGKTTFLKWLKHKLADMIDRYEIIYIHKTPEDIKQLVDIFRTYFKRPWYLKWLDMIIPNIKNIYELPVFLNKKLKHKKLVVLCDEAHETTKHVLSWIRSICDEVSHMMVVFSSLPYFEDMLKEHLETLRKRISTKVELLSLTKEEVKELIKKRIEYVGGTDITPFNDNIINEIYTRTGGFPREVVRLCDQLIFNCAMSNEREITIDHFEQEEKEKEVSLKVLESLTPLQNSILEFLATRNATPTEIAEHLKRDYKSKAHAIRSVNNILKKLMEQKYVERKRKGRAYIYLLASHVKTIFVKK